MGPPGAPECWMVQVSPPGDVSESPVFRHYACSNSAPLSKEFDGCKTLFETFQKSVRTFPLNRCLGHRQANADGTVGGFVFESYREVASDVQQIARAMANKGAMKGTRIGIYGANCPEWIKVMLACSSCAAICVPLYDALGGDDAAAFCIVHSGMELVFVQDKKLPDLAEAIAKGVAHWRAHHGAPDQPCSDGAEDHKVRDEAEDHNVSNGAEDHKVRDGAEDHKVSAGEDSAGLGADPVRVKRVVVWGRGFAPQDSHAAAVQSLYASGVEDVVSYAGFCAIYSLFQPTEYSLPLTSAMSLAMSSVSSSEVPDTVPAASTGDKYQLQIPHGSSPSDKPGTLTRPGPEDLCTIMYTSGTTGKPKGVMITHRALVSVVNSQITTMKDPWGQHAMAHAQQLAELPEELRKEHAPPSPHPAPRRFPTQSPEDAHLSYLPLAHIYERALVEACLATGAAIGCWQGDVERVQDDAAALKPAIMVGVPRVWERVKAGVFKKLASRTPIARYLFRIFYQRKLQRLAQGMPHARASLIGDLLVFRKVRAALGGELKLVVSGAAPLPRELEEFIRVALCCFAGQGYGLTETCSATCLAPPDIFDMLGTVGPVQTCADCKVVSVPEMGYDASGRVPRGELLLAGPCLFSGYYRAPEETRKVLSEEGWFRTGDCVEIQANGSLRIIDRIKHICKTSQGEYVALEAVETALLGGAGDFIAHGCCWVYADSTQRRPVAVVVPSKDALISWAHGEDKLRAVLSKAGFEGLCGHPEAAAFILSKLEKAGQEKGLPRFQRPAAVYLDSMEWTVESGLLTPTHKLRRHALQKHYAAQVENMYANLSA